MLTESANHLISRLTTQTLSEILWSLTFAVKEELSNSYPHEFYCPSSLQAAWFETEVNNLLLDQKLDLIKELCNLIQRNRNDVKKTSQAPNQSAIEV